MGEGEKIYSSSPFLRFSCWLLGKEMQRDGEDRRLRKMMAEVE